MGRTRCDSSWRIWYFPKTTVPQYRPQYNIILNIMGTPKKVPLILGNSHHELCAGRGGVAGSGRPRRHISKLLTGWLAAPTGLGFRVQSRSPLKMVVLLAVSRDQGNILYGDFIGIIFLVPYCSRTKNL